MNSPNLVTATKKYFCSPFDGRSLALKLCKTERGVVKNQKEKKKIQNKKPSSPTSKQKSWRGKYRDENMNKNCINKNKEGMMGNYLKVSVVEMCYEELEKCFMRDRGD